MYQATGGMVKQYKVTNCEFNQLHYGSIVGNLFNNPPGYAKVKVVWVDPMEWLEIGSDEEKETVEEYAGY